MHDTVVFLGPSMPAAEAGLLLDAQFAPPVCRGDLDALPAAVRYVGIIDGEFFQKMAISPKEILRALDRGVAVFGSSSMGALRAAETYTFGTVGVGRVFEQFRDGILETDDEVALTYEPGTYRAISDAMVNLREALALARTAGAITDSKHDELIATAKAWYFPKRSWRALENICPELRTFARGRELPDVKRDDARALLQQVRLSRSAAKPGEDYAHDQ